MIVMGILILSHCTHQYPVNKSNRMNNEQWCDKMQVNSAIPRPPPLYVASEPSINNFENLHSSITNITSCITNHTQ